MLKPPTVVRIPLSLCEGEDSNPRRHKPQDLKSCPFGHSGTLTLFILGQTVWPSVCILRILFIATILSKVRARATQASPHKNVRRKITYKVLYLAGHPKIWTIKTFRELNAFKTIISISG